STVGMVVMGPAAGAIAARFGSKSAVIVGSMFTAGSYGLIAAVHDHPYDMLISAVLLGVGIGLAFAALGNLIVEAVDPHQPGLARPDRALLGRGATDEADQLPDARPRAPVSQPDGAGLADCLRRRVARRPVRVRRRPRPRLDPVAGRDPVRRDGRALRRVARD